MSIGHTLVILHTIMLKMSTLFTVTIFVLLKLEFTPIIYTFEFHV